jgi:probable metal-binding protein
MSKAHVHEILEMINTNNKSYSIIELQEAVVNHFSKDMLFNSCSIENMNAVQAVDFLVERGKFIPHQSEASCCGACGG